MLRKKAAKALNLALSLALAFALVPAFAPGAPQQAEAETTINTFDELEKFLRGKGGSATLGEDINLDGGIDVVGNPELNLNGKSINVNTRAIYVGNDRTLTLKGPGTINCPVVILESTYSHPCGILKANDSVVFTSRVTNKGGTLDGGTYNATCANYNGGVIRGGTFNSEVTNGNSDFANGEIVGGTFSESSRVSNQTLTGGTFYGSVDNNSCDVRASANRSITFKNGDETVREDSVICGQKTSAPADPSRDATAEYTYAFDGWYTDATGGEKVTTFGPVLADTTYYAHWNESLRSYTVTWDLDGGSADMSRATGEAPYGTEIVSPASPVQPGKVFEGWWTDKTGGEQLHPGSKVTGNVTYHARWRDAVDVSTLSIAEIPAQTYTGADIEPALTIKDGQTTLTAGTDYEVSYASNRTVGAATVTIVGKGFYKGEVTRSFAIVPKTVSVTGIAAKSKSYDGTDVAELDVLGARIVGAVAEDDLEFSAAGHFDGADAGAGKKVFVALALHGKDFGNYRLETDMLELSADIRKADPALSVEAVESSRTFDDKHFQLQASSKSDATVSFKSTNESVLKVSNTGEVEVVGVGTGGIEVSVPETTNYLGTSKTLEITVDRGSGAITVQGAEVDKVYGDADFSIAPTDTSGGELSYTSGNTNVATVDSAGTVRILTAGTATITISLAQTATHKAATETIALKVAKRPVEVTWSAPTSFEHDGNEHSVLPSVSNAVTGDVVGLSCRDNAASEPGTYEATVTAVDNANYTLEGGKGLVCEWRITSLEPQPQPEPTPGPGPQPQPQPEPQPGPDPQPEPDPTPKPMPEPTPTPGPKQETGKSSSPALSQAGFDGKAITVTWSRVKGASGYRVYLAKCGSKGKLVRVGNLVATITSGATIKRTFTKLRNGKKLVPSAAYKLQVRPYKLVAGKRVDLAPEPTLYLVSSKSRKYASVKKVTVSSKSVALATGKARKLTAKVTKTSGKKLFSKKGVAQIRWRSSDPSVATVSSKGKVTAKKKGSCTVYAVALNGKRASVKVKVR